MSLVRFALKNIARSVFRSSVIVLCALFVTGSVLIFSVVLQNAETSLSESLERLGADLIVTPMGGVTQWSEFKSVRLMSTRSTQWMPRDTTDKIRQVEGVETASPQLYLLTLENSPFSNAHFLDVVAFDPPSDFTLYPWVEGGWDKQLPLGQALVGSDVLWQSGESASLLGYSFLVAGRLEPTGSEVDQTIFFSYDTAQEFIRVSQHSIGYDPAFIPNRATGILVRVDQRSDTRQVSMHIIEQVERIRPLMSTDMLQAERDQLIGLLWSGVWLLAIVTLLSMVVVGLVFSITVNERRQELGVLKAIGFPRRTIILSILMEGSALALLGGSLGVGVAVLGLSGFAGALQSLLGMVIHLPAWLYLLGNSAGGLLMAVASVALAALYPALRITAQEAALIMHE